MQLQKTADSANKTNPDAENFIRAVKLIHAVDTITIIHFLPIILNQFFNLMVIAENEEVSLNILK